MSIPQFVDGETDLDSITFNRIVNRVNAITDGTAPIALAGIEGALGEYETQRRIYNVYTYGARADNGVTDNYSAIQSAIDECSADGGGIVDFPEIGNYVYRSRPKIKSGVMLRGRGRGTVLAPEYTSLTTGFWYDDTNGVERIGFADLALSRSGANVHHGIQISRCDGLRMDNVSVIGSRAHTDGPSATGGGAIILGGFTSPGPSDLVQNVQIGRVYFEQADNFGLQLGWVRNVTVESILAERCYREVLGVEPGSGGTAENVVIGNVAIRQGGSHAATSTETGAVVITQSSGGTISGVSVGTVHVCGVDIGEGDATPGVYVLGGVSVALGSVNIRSMNGSGIRIGNLSHATSDVKIGSLSVMDCNRGGNTGHDGAGVSLRNASRIVIIGASILGASHTNSVVETSGADYNRVVYSVVNTGSFGTPAAHSLYADNVEV